MGSVELLSREGEIAIAKRIEAGREAMISGLCESPLTFQAIIIWRDELSEGKVFLRDIIDLEATYAGPDAKNIQPPAIGPDGKPVANVNGGTPVPGAPHLQVVPSAAPPAAPPSATPVQGDARRRRQGREGPGRDRRRRRLRRRRHGEFALARGNRGRAEAESRRDLRQHRRQFQAPAPFAGAGHREPPALDHAVAGAGTQVQEAEGRDHRRGEVAAAQPGAHRFAGRAALRHQQAAGRPTKGA